MGIILKFSARMKERWNFNLDKGSFVKNYHSRYNVHIQYWSDKTLGDQIQKERMANIGKRGKY